MQSNRHTLIAGILAVIIIAGISAYLYMHRATGPTSTVATSTASSTTTTTTVDGVTIQGAGTIKETTTQLPKTPNFRTPLTFSSTVPDDVRALLTKQFNATVAILEKDSTDFQAWINLGIFRKSGGDYAGAETDWKYAAALYPMSTVPTDNLGSLYLDFLKDYPKAEANYKLSITHNTHDINAYQQLFSLYTIYGYKAGTSAAADLVAAGLKANPGNETLLQLQSQLK